VIRKLSKTSCFYHAFICVHLRQKLFFGFKHEPGSIFDDFARTVLSQSWRKQVLPQIRTDKKMTAINSFDK
jgi:hypothetical protein